MGGGQGKWDWDCPGGRDAVEIAEPEKVPEMDALKMRGAGADWPWDAARLVCVVFEVERIDCGV
jgi:hypothetical protein